jgi:hypothetical protein
MGAYASRIGNTLGVVEALAAAPAGISGDNCPNEEICQN